MFTEKLSRCFVGVLSMFGFAVGASAQPLEDISLQYSDEGIVATIKLSGPVRYLRHFPAHQGKTLEIFYDRAQDSSNVEWLDLETRQSPPSGLIPGFTVTTHDQKVRPKLTIEFSRPAEFSVVEGSDSRSFLITIKPDKRQRTLTEVIPLLPEVKPLTAFGAPTDQAAADVNKQAFELMSAGRNALAGGDNSSAIEVFNKLLSLPPNPYTPDAQEWIGVARERAGQGDRAKAEYELYLKMYPNSEGEERVKIRLASVGKQKSTALLGTEGADKTKRSKNMAYGGISSRYYHGSSTIDTTYMFNNALSTATYSATDQSMLVTTADATERFVGDNTDNRLVFRDVQTHNYLPNASNNPNYAQNVNRVYAAYWETKNRSNEYALRLGRQIGSGGGILGRYDGVSGSYGTPEDWRTNAVIGRVADFSTVSKPFFYGASVDRGPVSLYALNQTVDGVLDRRAVGTELRYFEPGKTAYAQFDYDVSFRALNIAMMNGTLGVGSDGTSVNVILDHRKTPSLSTRNALNGGTATSVSSLLQVMTESEMRILAEARTATSNFSQIGVTHPLTKQWQIGGDVKFSNVSGMPASGTTPLVGILANTPGTGSTRTLTAQVIGNSLLTNLDIWSVSLNSIHGNYTNGKSLYIYNHSILREKWTLDTSWLYYRQSTPGSGTITRNTPTIRATYRYKEQLSFDGDFGLEMSKNSGTFQQSTTKRKFFSLGFRWDF